MMNQSPNQEFINNSFEENMEQNTNGTACP